MRIRITAALLLFNAFVTGQDILPTQEFMTDHVMIYDVLQPGGEPRDVFAADGSFKLEIRDSTLLSETEACELFARLEMPSSFGRAPAACHEPHFACRVYENNAVAFQFEVCLLCNRLQSSVLLPAQRQYPHGEGDRRYYAGQGVSNNFINYLQELKRAKGFKVYFELRE